ncbi:MAG: hypothetical protein ABFD94_18910 [Armatimonadia bacterium]
MTSTEMQAAADEMARKALAAGPPYPEWLAVYVRDPFPGNDLPTDDEEEDLEA